MAASANEVSNGYGSISNGGDFHFPHPTQFDSAANSNQGTILLTANISQTGARGASSYELWLNEGHEGTVDDFFRYLAQQINPIGEVKTITPNRFQKPEHPLEREVTLVSVQFGCRPFDTLIYETPASRACSTIGKVIYIWDVRANGRVVLRSMPIPIYTRPLLMSEVHKGLRYKIDNRSGLYPTEWLVNDSGVPTELYVNPSPDYEVVKTIFTDLIKETNIEARNASPIIAEDVLNYNKKQFVAEAGQNVYNLELNPLVESIHLQIQGSGYRSEFTVGGTNLVLDQQLADVIQLGEILSVSYAYVPTNMAMGGFNFGFRDFTGTANRNVFTLNHVPIPGSVIVQIDGAPDIVGFQVSGDTVVLNGPVATNILATDTVRISYAYYPTVNDPVAPETITFKKITISPTNAGQSIYSIPDTPLPGSIKVFIKNAFSVLGFTVSGTSILISNSANIQLTDEIIITYAH